MWHFSLVSVTHSIFLRFSITVFCSVHGTLTQRVRFSITVSVMVWYVVHGTHFFSRTVSVRYAV
jgi:hypothetical protein